MTQAGRAALIIGLGLAPIIGLASLAAASRSPAILYNDSPSEPTGFYRRVSEAPALGRIIAFHVPALGQPYAALRTRTPNSYTVLKVLAGMPGDRICNRRGMFSINGHFLGVAQTKDSARHFLPQWQGCRPLGDSEYFVFSNRIPNSFDSRYFGPVSRANILAVYAPLWTDS